MKYLALGSAALAAMMAAPAMAADMPVRTPAPVVAYYDWSGAYAGFNVGGAWYDVTHHFTTPGAITPDVATASSASTPARSGSGAPGCSAWKRR